jgi:hypothetical protein
LPRVAVPGGLKPQEIDMRIRLTLFIVGLICLVGCLLLLSRSPAWNHLGFADFMAMIGAGVSVGMLIMLIAISVGRKPGPPG